MTDQKDFKQINDLNEEAQERFVEIVDNIEEREATKERIAEDIKAAYAVAKDDGYDVKALRTLIARRKKMRKAGQDEILQEEGILAIYIEVVGDEQ